MTSLPDPTDPAASLAAVVSMRRTADRLALAAVHHAVLQGWTWAEIGQALGVTAQAAHKRYAKRLTQEEHHERT